MNSENKISCGANFDLHPIQMLFNQQDVQQVTALQRRLYRTIRETMCAMSGRISGEGRWEAKKILAGHVWLDTEHANVLRQRVLELRFPVVDVDLDTDKSLIAVLANLPSTNTDAEFLAGVYHVIKPAILAALERYLTQSDSLDGAPSHRLMRPVMEELRDELVEFETVWAQIPAVEHAQAAAWEAWVRQALGAAGGVFAQDLGSPLLARMGFSGRLRYTTPMIHQRDPRWLPAVAQVPPRSPRTPQEQQVWVAIDHLNELWACELSSAFIWHHEGMLWALYYDTARWAYDDMRHTMMSERRLQAYGFDMGVDVQMVPDHWIGVASRGGLEPMHFVLHGLEQPGLKWKGLLKSKLWATGDPYGSKDCDYDWGDESGHIRYGQESLKALFPDLPKREMIARTKHEVEQWMDWIKEEHRTGHHGYGVFMPRIDAKSKKMPALANHEFFKPFGSIAATTSYGPSN